MAPDVISTLLILALVISGYHCQDEAICQEGTSQFQDYNCYKQGSDLVPWPVIDYSCSTELTDSKPVSIKYEAEQEYLVEMAQGKSFWTGGLRVPGSNEFEWSDKSRVSGYKNWAEGQPGDNPSNNYLVVGADGKWLAVAANEFHAVMCELRLKWTADKLKEVLDIVTYNLTEQNNELWRAVNHLNSTSLDSITNVNGGISEVQTSIVTLGSEFTEANQFVEETRPWIQGANANLSAQESKFSPLEGSWSNIKTTIGSTGAQLDSLLPKITLIGESLEGYAGSLATLNDNVGNATADAKKLEENLGLTISKIDAVEQKVRENSDDISANKQAITDFLASLGSTNLLVDDNSVQTFKLNQRVNVLEGNGNARILSRHF